MSGHHVSHLHQILFWAKFNQSLCSLIFNTMTVKLTHFSASNSKLLWSCVVITTLCHSEIYWDSLVILWFLISNFVKSHMLQNANRVWITCIDISAIEIAMNVRFIELGEVGWVYSELYELTNVFMKVWQWHEGFIEEPLAHITYTFQWCRCISWVTRLKHVRFVIKCTYKLLWSLP